MKAIAIAFLLSLSSAVQLQSNIHTLEVAEGDGH